MNAPVIRNRMSDAHRWAQRIPDRSFPASHTSTSSRSIDMQRRHFVALTLGVASSMIAEATHAQNYPQRTIRFVLPYPPGGTTDGLLRPLAQYMSEQLGQPVVVENKPGANGIVGSDLVAKAAPDGYTLVLGAIGPFAVNSALQTLPYDPVRDFAPVALLASVPNVLVVSAATGISSVAQ